MRDGDIEKEIVLSGEVTATASVLLSLEVRYTGTDGKPCTRTVYGWEAMNLCLDVEAKRAQGWTGEQLAEHVKRKVSS